MVNKTNIMTSLMVLVLMATSAYANDLVINEVMSNEPGSNKNLEWIEIYNNTNAVKNLSFYRIIIRRNQFADTLQSDLVIAAYNYITLIADNAAYDSIWGDNSGIWGDDTLENYIAYKLPGLNLANDSGGIYLVDWIFTKTVSSFEWHSTGLDGVSWERVRPDSAEVRNSIDPSGSTPGRRNSVSPRDNDLGIASVRFWPDFDNETGFEIIIVNFGLNPIPETTLSIYYDLNQDTIVTNDDLIALVYLPRTSPGDSLDYLVYFELEGFLPYILIKLPDDDQLYNDIWLHQVFGREYPPVIISEFLPDPSTSFGVEWVELKNRSDLDIDLHGWLLGDEKTFHPIANAEYILNPGDYIVLCKDSAELADYYNDNSIPILEMSSWAILNNDNDIVRLKDNFGFVVDSLPYDHVFGGNHTWARGEGNDMADRWGWSADIGGTPGRINNVYLEPIGFSIILTAEPNPFSIEHDGEMTIAFSLPPGENITLKIYDLQGRAVRTLIDGLPPYDGTITWRGDSDSGRRLKVGMYVLYMEVSGVEQYKQTIVIAP